MIIEDAAEAHGAEYKGRSAAGWATLSCFSFYANKIITTGEGGMVLTNDPRSRRKACVICATCASRKSAASITPSWATTTA